MYIYTQRYFKSQELNPTTYNQSAPGHGKTQEQLSNAKANLIFQNTMFQVPTRELAQELFDRAKEDFSLEPVLITSDTNPGKVQKSIVEFLKAAPQNGEVLIITQETANRLPYFPRIENWKIIMDEPGQIFGYETFPALVNGSTETLLEYVQLDAEAKSIPFFDRVKPVSRSKVRELLIKGQHDALYEVYRELFEWLLSPYKDVYVCSQSWMKMIEKAGNHTAKGQDRFRDANKLHFFWHVRADFYEGKTITEANFESGLLHEFLKAQGIPMHERKLERVRRFRNRDVELMYLQDDRWSKRQGNSKVRFEGEIISKKDAYTTLALRQMDKSKPVGVVTNKDRERHVKRKYNEYDIRIIPVMSQGSNEWDNVDQIIFEPGLNPKPKLMSFLKEFGYDPAHVKFHVCTRTAYQAITRGSIRNPNCGRPFKVVFISLEDAGPVEGQLNEDYGYDPALQKIDISEVQESAGKGGGRPRKHADDNERKRAYKKRKKAQKTADSTT